MVKYYKPSHALAIIIVFSIFILFLISITAYFLKSEPVTKTSAIQGRIAYSDIMIIRADLLNLKSINN